MPEGEASLRVVFRTADGKDLSCLLRGLARLDDVVMQLREGLPPDTLHVRVVDPQGNPVHAAELWFDYGRGGMGADVERGRAEVKLDDDDTRDGLRSDVIVSEARDGAGTWLPLGRTRLEGVRLGQSVEVRMAAELAIEGQVLDAAGKGVAGVRVRAEPIKLGEDATWIEGAGSWYDVPPFLTDAEGRFRVGQLGAGTHQVAILPPPAYAIEPSQRAQAGASDVVFRLRAAVRATLRVLDGKGRAVAGARVFLTPRGAGGEPVEIELANAFSEYSGATERTTSAEGEARFEGLDPTRLYILGIVPPSKRSELAEHVAADWEPRDETVTLGIGEVVAGVVYGADAKPAPGVMVSCRRANGVDTQVTTDAKGAFRFQSLAKGDVELQAYQHDGDASATSGRRQVATGSTEVRLQLLAAR